LLYPGIRISTTAEYVEVYWRAGIYDKFYQVAFETGVSTRDRVLEIVDVKVGTDYVLLCMSSPFTSPMPAVGWAPLDTQYLRHWVFGMRMTSNVQFVQS